MRDTALGLTKERIGLSTKVRDQYLEFIIDSVISELEGVQGLSLVEDDPHHLMFIVDYADWRYSNRETEKGMPRHLQYRLHNMILKEVTENE